MRAVLDTNVLVAAFLTEGICARLLTRARKRDFELVLCSAIVREFESVLKRKFSVVSHEIAEAAAILSEAASEIREEAISMPRVCRDPDDDLILVCAQESRAEYLVTGDEDLLVLRSFNAIKIMRPRDFESLFPD